MTREVLIMAKTLVAMAPDGDEREWRRLVRRAAARFEYEREVDEEASLVRTLVNPRLFACWGNPRAMQSVRPTAEAIASARGGLGALIL